MIRVHDHIEIRFAICPGDAPEPDVVIEVLADLRMKGRFLNL